jgi:DNA-binding NtrC family response regulator
VPNNQKRSTILVVEDDTLVRMVGADVLQDAGFDVIEASNADEALVLLSQVDDVQLLFSDVDMPGSMNGIELARQVHERWPDIRLLITSGQHDVSPDRLPDDGKFVRKPWTHDVLVQKVRDVLRH